MLYSFFALFFFLFPGSVIFRWKGWEHTQDLFSFFLFLSVLVLSWTFYKFIRKTLQSFSERKKAKNGVKNFYDVLESVLFFNGAQDPTAKTEILENIQDMKIPFDLSLPLLQGFLFYLMEEKEKAFFCFKKAETNPLSLWGLLKTSSCPLEKQNILMSLLKKKPNACWLFDVVLKNQKELLQEKQEIKTFYVLRRLDQKKRQKQEADLAFMEGNLKKAYTLYPLDYAYAYAQELIEEKQETKALKVLQHAYKEAPQEEIIKLYLKHFPDAIEGYKNLEKFVSGHSNHPISIKFLFVAALRANFWGVAKKHREHFFASAKDETKLLLAQMPIEKNILIMDVLEKT